MKTKATLQKRAELTDFINQELKSKPAIQGVVGIGSIASGLARPDSDIDAIVILDPFDGYIVPAEFKWNPVTGTFHSIFAAESAIEKCIQFDFYRLDLRQWRDPAYAWPEGRCAELRQGWLAFDREGIVAKLIASRTAYTERIRLAKLDEALTWLDQHLSENAPPIYWESLGPIIAHDQLQAAYSYLVQALFAYNGCWRPWRNREMASLINLSWLPPQFVDQVLVFQNPAATEYEGYLQRVEVLQQLFQALLKRLVDDQVYGDDMIGEAFRRGHEEPGRAWNMEDWNLKHREKFA
jgi:predicted nucleotidyltransferase